MADAMTVAAPDRPSRHFLAAVLLIPLTAIALGWMACQTIVHTDVSRPEPWLAFSIGIPALAFFYWHRFRGLGMAAVGIVAAFGIISAAGVLLDTWPVLTGILGSACLCLSFTRLSLFLVRTATRSTFWQTFFLFGGMFGLGFGVLLAEAGLPPWLLCGYLLALALAACIFLFRPLFEFAVEPVLWVMYRIRGVGPGLARIPTKGPCLVVANHACWFDPLFLAKVLPRPITPMMTSRFYDKPVLRFLCRRVFHAIRVPETPRKQAVPEEITAAIAALDRGDCLVIFPEGYLRRSDDKPLRRFGRGVWQILAARPQTPVFACWIEGGWGSFCSYRNGNPTKGKRPDFRRPVGVAAAEPLHVDAAMLENHLDTRMALMDRVLAARTLLEPNQAAGSPGSSGSNNT